MQVRRANYKALLAKFPEAEHESSLIDFLKHTSMLLEKDQAKLEALVLESL